MENNKRLTWLIAVVYLLLVIWIILFKLSMPSEIAELDHIRRINLIPFHYDAEVSGHLSEVLENLLIFIPVGVYLKMLGKPNLQAVLIGGGISLALEIAQYCFGIGATDITDLITNTVGAAVGMAIYLLLGKLVRNRDKLNKALNILSLIVILLFIAMMVLLRLAN